ncbi:MAG: hypothetical protein H6551_13365 [Chitinophagales bacterium]|nr:hypothetical protein [Chitinophagaceae bacterium]MCB9066122.1 hypothetical protein [Chitinophagales bacterium]
MQKPNIISAVALVALFAQGCGDGIPREVNFTEHVAPIIYKNCTECHRPEGIGHFDIITYQDAKRYASGMAFAAKEGMMPPWPADPHYTSFVGERIMSKRDIQILEKWVKDGLKEGPQDKMPSLPDYKPNYLAGKPDVTIPVKPIFLEANGFDKFLIVKVPFELPQDTFASLVEFIPGKNNLVHHVNGDMVIYDDSRKENVFEGEYVTNMVHDSTIRMAFEKLGLPNDDGTYPALQKSVVNYLPGAYGQKYPQGLGGYRLPKKGAFLLNDLHYGFTSDEAVWDSSYINIYYSKEPPKRPVQEFQLGTLGVSPVEPDLIIQPNTVKKVYSKLKIPEDISIMTVNPHMHLLGKSFKAYALTPEGDTIRLVSIPKWDFHWQYFYTFKKMLKIPKGSTIVAEGVYDNTRKNLNNPFSPPRLIKDNDGSMRATDEMFQFIVTYVMYEQGDEDISLDVSNKD